MKFLLATEISYRIVSHKWQHRGAASHSQVVTPDGKIPPDKYRSVDHFGWLNGNLKICVNHLEIALVDAKQRNLGDVEDISTRLCRVCRLVDADKAIAYAGE